MTTAAENAAEIAGIKADMAALMAAVLGSKAPTAPPAPAVTVTTDKGQLPTGVWTDDGKGHRIPAPLPGEALGTLDGMRFSTGNTGWHVGGKVWIPGYGYASLSCNVILEATRVEKSPEERDITRTAQALGKAGSEAVRQGSTANADAIRADMLALAAKYGMPLTS